MSLFDTFFDELAKLGTVTSEDARRSLDRLDSLEKNRPTAGQVARYGGLGAVGGVAIGSVGNLIEHGTPFVHFPGATPRQKALSMAAGAAKGAISSGAIPLVRAHLDRRAEMGTLRRYMQENAAQKTAATIDQLRQAYRRRLSKTNFGHSA